jgi:hypothetical protein
MPSKIGPLIAQRALDYDAHEGDHPFKGHEASTTATHASLAARPNSANGGKGRSSLISHPADMKHCVRFDGCFMGLSSFSGWSDV